MERDVPAILFADDESSLVELYELFLEQKKYDVVTAANGQEVLDLVGGSIDAVVLDRQMPKMTGDEALRTLRDRGHSVPVGLISAVDPGSDILDMPLDAYLTKPLGREGVLKLVERLVLLQDVDEQFRTFHRLVSKKVAMESTGRVSMNDPIITDLSEQVTAAQAEVGEEVTDFATDAADQALAPVDVRSNLE